MCFTLKYINAKYPEDRGTMTPEREKEFVNDAFSCYENEGFSKEFWTPYKEHKDRNGESFEVIKRATPNEQDLCVLPMWQIKFQDGTIIYAYPEEIIPSEIQKHKKS